MVTGYPQGADKISARLRSAPLTELADWLLGKLPLTEAARVEAPAAHQAGSRIPGVSGRGR